MSSAVIDETPISHQAPTAEDVSLLAEADSSVRLPALLFFGAAILWLLTGCALKALALFELNFPGLLADFSWLTYGRIEPAANDSLLYGWALQAGFGAGLWILARLSQARSRHGGLLVAVWALWNVAVHLGVLAIVNGQGTSMPSLEFPRFVTPLLFTASVFLAIFALNLFRERRESEVYVAQKYVLAGFCWFVWAYASANLVLFFLPAQAPAQAVVAAWYAHSLVVASLIPFALGAAYYIVPKVAGAPVHHRPASAAFWAWMLLAGWSGAYGLIGGPIPAWLISVSIVANALSLLPVAAILGGLLAPLKGRERALRHSPSLRFTLVGLYCFLAATIFSIALGFRGINGFLHFTAAMRAQQDLIFYAFVSMGLFGAIYYIVPRLLGLEWPSSGLLRSHFWLIIVGAGLLIIGSFLGGCIQGLGLADAKVPPIAILSLIKPFFVTDFVAMLILIAGEVCLTASFLLMLLRGAWALFALRPAHAAAPLAPQTAVPVS